MSYFCRGFFKSIIMNRNFIKGLLIAVLCCSTISAEAMDIFFRCEKIDTKPTRNDFPKVPPCIPKVNIEGCTLCFETNHPEYIINIVQDDVVVFTALVHADATQYELPQYITGDCVLQLIRGNYCFWAEIEL